VFARLVVAALRCSNVLNAKQGEPGNGLDFDWMKNDD
jgi:hypothetical protein